MLEAKSPAQSILRQIIFCYFLIAFVLILQPGLFYLLAVEFPIFGLLVLSFSGTFLWTSYRIARYALWGT